MTCQGCASSVSNAITAVAPDSKISVDLDAKQVTVDGCDDASIIAQAVDDAGFEFAGPV
jgi:copper chaperone|tara:strand:- start:266 stop:442 length:177 start_codon:yes stop_codon:yes gene_type:complete